MKDKEVKKRPRKKTDQENAELAYQVLLNTMQFHSEIEQTLWASACWTLLVRGYLNSGVPYEEFCEDFDSAKEHYKKRWFEENK